MLLKMTKSTSGWWRCNFS